MNIILTIGVVCFMLSIPVCVLLSHYSDYKIGKQAERLGVLREFEELKEQYWQDRLKRSE